MHNRVNTEKDKQAYIVINLTYTLWVRKGDTILFKMMALLQIF